MSTIFNQKFFFFVYLKIIVLRRKYISQVDQYQLSRNHYHSTTHTHTHTKNRRNEEREEKRRERRKEKKSVVYVILICWTEVEENSEAISCRFFYIARSTVEYLWNEHLIIMVQLMIIIFVLSMNIFQSYQDKFNVDLGQDVTFSCVFTDESDLNLVS